MKITKVKDQLVIDWLDRTVTFDGLPAINRKKNTLPNAKGANGEALSRDALLMMELQRYLSTLMSDDKEELFEAYQLISDLSTESPEVIEKHLPEAVAVIDRIISPETFAKMYPYEHVWIPDKMPRSYDGLSPNYQEDMTYIAQEYYELMLLTLMTKAYIPVFNVMGTYINGKGVAQDTKRRVVHNSIAALEMLADTKMMQMEAVPRLNNFLRRQVEKFQAENSKLPYGTSLSVLASICGYGSDMVEDYLLAFTIVQVLALHPVGGDFNSGNLSDNNIVARIYWSVKQEVDSGFANRISNQQVNLKQHPTKVMFNGEKGKTTAIDLVKGRSSAPVKESVRTGVSVTNYRRFLKYMAIETPPAEVKALIDSLSITHTGPSYELHVWLVTHALHRWAHRKSFCDLERPEFICAMALAQALYLRHGMPEVAQLLSCEMRPGNPMGYPIDPIDSDVKIKSDRFYPQAYKGTRTTHEYSAPLRQALALLLSDHVSPYYFHLKATPEAAAILRCDCDVPDYRPSTRIQSQLAEFLFFQARNKCEEVAWFNS